jgi:hypothetical protein
MLKKKSSLSKSIKKAATHSANIAKDRSLAKRRQATKNKNPFRSKEDLAKDRRELKQLNIDTKKRQLEKTVEKNNALIGKLKSDLIKAKKAKK